MGHRPSMYVYLIFFSLVIHQLKSTGLVNVLEWCCDYLVEFQLVNSIANDTVVGACVNGQLNVERWNPFGVGLYKLNIDAALQTENCNVGIGAVIRNHEGLVMAATTQRIEANYNLEVAKAVATLRGIIFVVDTGLVPIIVESNYLSLLRRVVDEVSTDAYIGLLVSDILCYLRNRAVSLVLHVLRKANKVAH
ncbi:hypothetical protein Dsin_001366 [Dipteronia sinensis]|uniref:RNase H type-1 domain-containing protein n=1 Tax=Dipteronia sinensis TaxID=43782 RepID=A0AAE0B545_9ROSI|nr:hypothetical protein Dsin_001366 [Dipteronia sinensis]